MRFANTGERAKGEALGQLGTQWELPGLRSPFSLTIPASRTAALVTLIIRRLDGLGFHNKPKSLLEPLKSPSLKLLPEHS